MNESSFSIKHFMNFFQLEIVLKKRKLLMYCILIIGTLLGVALFMGYEGRINYIGSDNPGNFDAVAHAMVPVYFVLFFIFGSLSASIMWTELRNKEGRMSALMNPASYLEKYLVKWCIYVLIFIVIFVFACFFAETVRYLVFHAIYPDADIVPLYLAGKYSHEDIRSIFDPINTKDKIVTTIMAYIALQSLFVLGAIVWTRNSFIKSFVFFGCIALIYFLVVMGNLVIFADGGWDETPPLFRWINNHELPVAIVILGFICLLNWTLAYFRLRETDVVTVKR